MFDMLKSNHGRIPKQHFVNFSFGKYKNISQKYKTHTKINENNFAYHLCPKVYKTIHTIFFLNL